MLVARATSVAVVAAIGYELMPGSTDRDARVLPIKGDLRAARMRGGSSASSPVGSAG